MNKLKTFFYTHPSKSTAVILIILILIFLSPTLARGLYLMPVWDLNDMQVQMLPWYHLSGELIKSGHLPFWNIYSGNGLPLFANMQTSALFPLTWLFYFLNFKVALYVYSITKMLLIGMFMFWYLRELKLKITTCLFGAIIYTFAGFNSIWYLWPLTDVLMFLPLNFFLIERFANNKKLSNLLWLSITIAAGIAAGHPQTFFYATVTTIAYAIYKLIISSYTFKSTLRNLAITGGAMILGVAISAPVLLPFLEYLKLSANLVYRAGFTTNPFFLPKALFLANIIPDFFGHPRFLKWNYLLVPNYGEYALGYLGITAIVLAMFAFGKKNNHKVAFFAVGSVILWILIYGFNPIYEWVNKLPGFNLNYNNRLLYVSAFFLTILASFGLERFRNGQISKRRFYLSLFGFMTFTLLLSALNKNLTSHWSFPADISWRSVSSWQNIFILIFFLNLLISGLLLWKLPKKPIILPILLLLVFFETGIHGTVFTRPTTQENFYPTNPALSYLTQKFTADHLRTFTYGHLILANIGTWYGINQLTDHDTMYLESNKQLKKNVADFNYSPEYTFSAPNLNALRFLSVGYLLYPPKEGREILQAHPEDLKTAYSGNDLMVIALKNPLPRAFFVPASDKTELNEKLKQLMQNPDINSIIPVSDFAIKLDGTEQFSYTAPNEGYIITTDNYYPDWRAEFGDNLSADIEDAGGLRAVKVTPGSGQLKINYHPNSFYLGLKISLGAVLL